MKSLYRAILAATLSTTIAGCDLEGLFGGGGNDDTAQPKPGLVQPLPLPKAITLSNTLTQNQKPADMHGQYKAFSTSTDFDNDTANTYRYSSGLWGAEYANLYLCVAHEVDAYNKVNQGTYKATFNLAKCARNTSPSYVDITVNSTRHDNNSPHYIDLGVENLIDNGDGTTTQNYGYAQYIIYKESDINRPLGEFELKITTSSDLNSSDMLIKSTNPAAGPRVEVSYRASFTNTMLSTFQFYDTSLSSGLVKYEATALYQDTLRTFVGQNHVGDNYYIQEFGFADQPLLTQLCNARSQEQYYVDNYGLYDSQSGARINHDIADIPYIISSLNDMNGSTSVFEEGQEILVSYDSTYMTIPQFYSSIVPRTGTTLGANNEYKLKALEIWIDEKDVPLSNCTNLGLDPANAAQLVLPNVNDIINIGININDRPQL